MSKGWGYIFGNAQYKRSICSVHLPGKHFCGLCSTFEEFFAVQIQVTISNNISVAYILAVEAFFFLMLAAQVLIITS